MSMVYGIVQDHNGYITVSSEPDAGTTISILLPLTFKSKIDKQISSPFYNTLNETETILLVDDDDHIRKLLKRVLIKMGYKVYSADNCKLAENIMKKYSTEIDLLLIDVIMPQLSGKEIFDRLLILKPELKVIFMSGYSGDSHLIKEITSSNHPFIEKPISFTKLATTLKKLLEK
jgi:DNA-binding NtrC family response regulator